MQIDDTQMSPQRTPTLEIEPGKAIPATQTPEALYVITDTDLQEHDDATVTSPATDAGQLTSPIDTSSDSCAGSIVWVPATLGSSG